jgi:hypothetical protein
MEEYKIDFLTKKQVAFLNIMWACESLEQFSEWFDSLPYQDKATVENLLVLLQMEIAEKHEMQQFEEDAKNVISTIMAK